MAFKRDTYTRAAAELQRLAEQLRSESRSHLMRLVRSPMSADLELDGRKFQIGAWAEVREDERLSVVAEVRRNRWFGASKVQVEGFFVEPDGRITTMAERDLWDHGY